jgi:hypothetical protein
MATQNPAAEAKQIKRPRSPIERGIVWGVIAVLLVAVAVELWDRRGFQADYHALTEALQAAESTHDKSVTESDVKSLVRHHAEHTSEKGLSPNALSATRLDTYTYRGLVRRHVLYVYYGHHKADEEPDVISVGTEKAESLEEAVNKAYLKFDAEEVRSEAQPQSGASSESAPGQTP